MALSFFEKPSLVFGASIVLRAVLLCYGAWQDANSAVKYTDIDYIVFTDAARYVSRGDSPYARDTYRYTPLLAWLLLPTSWDGRLFFAFGKALFALSDVLAGWLIAQSLMATYGISSARALKYASVWLLNPMVANISTRGSSEGLLCVLVIALLWAVLNRRITLAGVLLGLGVHFKIYPFIYGSSILWWLDSHRDGSIPESKPNPKSNSSSNINHQQVFSHILNFITPSRLHLTLTALTTFFALNLSITLLYLSAAGSVHGSFESLAFLPQLLLSVFAIPLVLAKRSLPGAMLAQTFATSYGT
ncbi:hypothetical protein EYZ11_000452 [Aspergillus tanneri]|uniref:GPI mannosyltransferase 1 n=1 Tax=Aspergillus tanneri TaxID=1220188 RepID=A0A4S3JX77_9EURO|nr:hypothetical protein EYZ11_000452 [Aspergillus tanneri]